MRIYKCEESQAMIRMMASDHCMLRKLRNRLEASEMGEKQTFSRPHLSCWVTGAQEYVKYVSYLVI